MNPHDDRGDRELAAAFSALRQEEQGKVRPFAEVVRQGRARSRRNESFHRLRWAIAAGLLLAVLAAWFGLRTRETQAPAGTPSLAEWRSPTDFLLETSGHEILAAPAGWGRSMLDLNPDSQAPERRSPS